MDFIKKHFEKILLTGALLVLIGVAGFLAWKVEKLSAEVNAGLKAPERERGLTFTPTVTYSNAMVGLKTPAAWRTNSTDPFHTEIEIVKAPTVVTNTIIKSVPIVGPKQPFALVKITRMPFKLVFKSYSGQGENFAINEGKRTMIVSKAGDKIWSSVDKYDTGYVVTKFELKKVQIEVPGISGAQRMHDVSELTIQRGSEPSIVLVINRVTEERDPEAVVTCLSDNQEMPVRKGQSVACGGKIYNVVDISLRQVIIVDDQSKEQFKVIKE